MKTYEFGLQYANSFRALKGHTNKVLAPFGITAFEWALLGLLYEDESGGMRTTQLASELFVSKAMVSKTCRSLEKRFLLKQSKGVPTDKRAVCYELSNTAREQVPKIESALRADLKRVLGTSNKFDMLLFYKSSTAIVQKLRADIDHKAVQ